VASARRAPATNTASAARSHPMRTPNDRPSWGQRWTESNLVRVLTVLVLLGALTTGAVAEPTSQQPPPGGGKSQVEHKAAASEEHQDSEGTKQHPSAPAIITPIEQSPRENMAAPQSKEEGNWYARPDWWVAGFTGLLFLATAGLWLFTGLLWRTTTRAVADGEKGLAAATKAAAAAEKSADVAVTTLRDLERPYVFVSDIWLPNGEQNLAAQHISFDLTNHGRTPAIMRKLTVRLRLVETVDEQIQTLDETETLLISRVIGAGQPIKSIGFGKEWLRGNYEAVEWSTLRAYVDIVIWYDDVFDNPTRINRFYYVFDPKAWLFARVQDVFDFDYYTEKRD
jgi:hypothetical protein